MKLIGDELPVPYYRHGKSLGRRAECRLGMVCHILAPGCLASRMSNYTTSQAYRLSFGGYSMSYTKNSLNCLGRLRFTSPPYATCKHRVGSLSPLPLLENGNR